MKKASLLRAGSLLALGLLLSLPQTARAIIPQHDCSFCHDVHGAPGTQLTNETDVEVLCLTCHGAAGTSSLKAAGHVGQTCMVCHDPHSLQTNWLGGTNLKLLLPEVIPINTVTPRPLVFESRGSSVGDPTLHSFCDGDEDGNAVWDGPCDTCHVNLGRHNYPEPGTHAHQRGRTCTRSNCHVHSTGFIP